MYLLYDREIQNHNWKCAVHGLWSGNILWHRGRLLSVDMQQLPRLFWQFVYCVFYIFGLFLQRWIYRSQWGSVHRMRRWKIQKYSRNGVMHRLSHVFNFACQ